MGMFSKKKKYDPGKRGTAEGSLPGVYMDVWKERESSEGRGVYADRISEIETAINRVRAASSSTEAEQAAKAVLSDPLEAEFFIKEVQGHHDDKLRALALLEAHKRTFPVALKTFQAEHGMRVDEFIGEDEHEWRLHAACLAHLRQFVSLETWDAFIEITRAAQHGNVVAPILEKVRTRFPSEENPFTYPTWLGPS